MSVTRNDSAMIHFRTALAGNPNCGKTTLFNACTGAKARTANWPGVTVSVESGEYRSEGICATLYDLPGIYDLTSRSAEERLAQEFILGGNIDIIINIADATTLERSLYLTLRLRELGVPIVMALNMTDVLKARSGQVDTALLSRSLGIPVVEVCARRGQGIAELLKCAADISRRKTGFSTSGGKLVPTDAGDAQVFATAERIASRCIRRKADTSRFTERVDNLLCRPLTGVPILILIMAAVFFLTFAVGDRLRDILESLISTGIETIEQLTAGFPPWSQELLCGAALPAVGAVISFIPNLFILYLCLAILDDSGYMPRAAFIADSMMEKLALSGKAFLPMLLGFGCSVPALLASRIVDGDKPRRRLALAIPFIPCGARLPVCVMFAGMFFGNYPAIVCSAVYALGVCFSFIALKLTAPGQSEICVSDKTDCANRHSSLFCKCRNCQTDFTPLIMEMPDFRSPGIRNILTVAARKVGEYLKKAGTLIFLSSIVLHFLICFGTDGAVASPVDSFGATIGKLIAPVLVPCGLGYWQIALALICAIGAKEMAVSSLMVLCGTSSLPALRLILTSGGFNSASALAFMVFTVLYIPCISTLATIRAQCGWRSALSSALFSLASAYAVAFVVYRIALVFI